MCAENGVVMIVNVGYSPTKEYDSNTRTRAGDAVAPQSSEN